MSATRVLPELLPIERFLRLLSHLGLVSAVVGDHFAVIIVDIDGIDVVGARHGAAAESACSATIADRLRSVLPLDALLTRLDGHAFGILAFGAENEPAALRLANTLHQAIRAPIDVAGASLRMSASIGVAFTTPAVRPVQALERADAAVIRVKLNGGDATWVDASVSARAPRTAAPSQHTAVATMPEPVLSSLAS